MNLCIAVLDSSGYSMTFVRKHETELFPESTYILSGGIPPRLWDGEITIPFMDWPSRFKRLGRRLINREQRYRPHEIARLLKAKKIDVVLAEFGGMGVAVVDACELAGIPVVVHFHGVDAYGDDELKINAERYRAMFPRCAKVVAVSNHMVEQLKHLGCPNEKLVMNPYGVDVDSFKGAQPELNPPIFLSVGRFVEKKSPILTILAFHKVATQHPSAKLRMIGDGPLLEDAKMVSRVLGLSDRVEFLGVMNADEVMNEMQNARVFVQHSRRAQNGDCEGTPNSILEAASCWLPVVSTRHCGIVEAVVDGETGFLVDEGDAERMAEAMERLIAEEKLCSQLGEAARKHICENYNDNERLDCLRQILRDVLSGK
jgi:colanic acid/amylovoran biosynthesis glycosyltransferase